MLRQDIELFWKKYLLNKVKTSYDDGGATQGCTKFGILVKGLSAKHRFGSQFWKGLNSQPVKSTASHPIQPNNSLRTAILSNKPLTKIASQSKNSRPA